MNVSSLRILSCYIVTMHFQNVLWYLISPKQLRKFTKFKYFTVLLTLAIGDNVTGRFTLYNQYKVHYVQRHAAAKLRSESQSMQ